MNADCIEEIFNYLSLRDLVAFGETCKRLCQIAGHWYRQNYQGYRVYNSDYIQKCYFNQFLQKIYIFSDQHREKFLQSIHYPKSNCYQFLKDIKFEFMNIAPAQIDGLKNFYARLKRLNLNAAQLMVMYLKPF